MASEKDNYYVSSLVRKLQSNSSSTVQKTLISLTRATKKSENVSKFRVEGGIKTLLQFIQTSNRKIVDLAASVLANCAMENESRIENDNIDEEIHQTKKRNVKAGQIKRLNGLTHLDNILTSLNEPSILSRVTRAFANMSVDPATAQRVVNLDVVPKLVNLLKETTDQHFQQNIIRALRIIGKISDGKKEVVDCNGLQCITELLRSENKDIKTCCLQTLQELSKTGDRGVAEQIQDHRAIEAVIEMTYSDDTDLSENAVLTLSNITTNASVRVSVGTIGGIEAFIHHIQKRSSRSLVLASIEGVCMCCREAVNRNKVRTCGGLEVLLEILRCPEYSKSYDRILGAFVCFSYDELALNRLIINGIVPALISFLRRLIFPEQSVESESVSEKHESQSKTQLGKESSSPSDNSAITSPKSSMTSLAFKPAVKRTHLEAQKQTSSDSRAEYPSWVSSLSALSPSTSISPSCSPDLHMSYMSPVNLHSAPDGSFSPMVYSPSGSEFGDDTSSEDSFFEKNSDEIFLAGSNEHSRDAVSASVSNDCQTTTSEEATPLSGETTTIFEDTTAISEDTSAISEDTTTISEDMTTTFEDTTTMSEDTSATSRDTTTTSEDTTTTSEDTTITSEDTTTTSKDTTTTSEVTTTTSKDTTTTSEDTTMCLNEAHAQDNLNLNISEVGSPITCIPPLQTASSHHAITLLPRASVDDHLYMFLPKENLFSADQPSHKKTDNVAIPRSRRARRNSSPSILKGSSASPRSLVNSPPSLSYSGELCGAEKKIMFLLSRFGQMPNPTEALITPSCIQTLMDYLSYSLSPDPRCVRLLNRLTCDVNNFEALVLHMVPGALYRQLGCGFGPGYHLGTHCEGSKVELESGVQQHSGVDCEGFLGTTKKAPLKLEDLRGKDVLREILVGRRHSGVCAKTFSDRKVQEPAGLDSTGSQPVIESKFPGQKERLERSVSEENKPVGGAANLSSSRTAEIGESLLATMTNQAGTSFGEGQLAHLLLRGSQKQKRACALSLPYLCRPMRLKRKLLLEYNGILTILSTLSDPKEEDDVVRGVESLIFLISNSSLRLPKRQPRTKLFIRNDLLGQNALPAKTCQPSADTSRHTMERGYKDESEVSSLKRRKNEGEAFGRATESGYKDESEVSSVKLRKTEGELSPTVQDSGGSKATTLSTALETAVVVEFSSKRRKVDVSLSKSVMDHSADCCHYEDIKEASYDVVLKLDSGETINAHRSVVSATSDVFQAMLSNDYVEATQAEVSVKDIEYIVLLFIVHFAYGCKWYFEPDTINPQSFCSLLEKCLRNGHGLRVNFDFLIELFVCADRFLLDGLKDQCEQLLLWCVNEERVVDMYLYGACYNATALRDFSLEFIFLGNLTLRCAYQNMKRLLDSKEHRCVLEDLKTMALCCL